MNDREVPTRITIDSSGVIAQTDEQVNMAKSGGITAINHTVTKPNTDWDEAVDQIRSCDDWIRSRGDVELVLTVEDLHSCVRSGMLGVIYGPQDASFLDTEIGRVDEAYDLGIRILQLTYQDSNALGDGCGVDKPEGLTPFGRDVVRAMNELGIVVDLSHVSQETARDALDLSEDPVVFTHAHSATLTPHPRSKDDGLIRDVADAGGMIGVTGSSSLSQLLPGVRPDYSVFLRHVEHLIELVGVGHVGIGLDFDATNTEVEYRDWHAKHPSLDTGGHVFPFDQLHNADIETVADWEKFPGWLEELSLEESEIAMVLGGNWLSLFDKVWRQPRSGDDE